MATQLYRYKFFWPKSTAESRQVNIRLLNVGKKFGKYIKNKYEYIVSNWEHNVEFDVKVGYIGGNVEVKVSTGDAAFFYLEEGTKIRHAKLSKDWRSKTAPGVLGPDHPGSGRVLSVSRWYRGKGITARRWNNIIERLYVRSFEKAIVDAMLEGLEAATKITEIKSRR